MKKRAFLIFLCIALTLSLAACGDKETGKDPKPSDEPTSGQTASKPSEPKDDATEPEDDTTEPSGNTTEPEDDATEPATDPPTEPATEPPAKDPQVQAAADFLELLKAEYNSDTAVGITAKHFYSKWGRISLSPAITYCIALTGKDTACFYRDDFDTQTWYSYNYRTKELTELPDFFPDDPDLARAILYSNNNYSFYLDGYFYFVDPTSNLKTVLKTDMSGNKVPLTPYENSSFNLRCYGSGLYSLPGNSQNEMKLYSMDLEELASVPVPQKEIAHGLTEPFRLRGNYSVGGKIYRKGNTESDSTDYLFCLDPSAATPEWTNLGKVSDQPLFIREYMEGMLVCEPIVGKYYYCLENYENTVFDLSTGEAVFELGELYKPVAYFGGDRYIGYGGSPREYRWVDLSTRTMSDPLKLPDKLFSLYFLNETYCIYTDEYGVFLWNYETGEETTIFMDKT